MPVSVSCAACQRKLKVRDAALGSRVRCPACGKTFVARLDADSDDAAESADGNSSEATDDTYTVQAGPSPGAPASRPPDVRPGRRRRRPAAEPDDEEDEDRRLRAHRGPLILTLGILSIVLSCIPLAGWGLGAASMTMGSADERLMDERWMERSGRGMTKAGQICGIIGVFLATVTFILGLVLRMRYYTGR